MRFEKATLVSVLDDTFYSSNLASVMVVLSMNTVVGCVVKPLLYERKNIAMMRLFLFGGVYFSFI